MKMDAETRRWLWMRVAGSYIVFAVLLILLDYAGMRDEPAEISVLDVFAGVMSLWWGISLLFWALEATNRTRKNMGLRPHWKQKDIDELEARIEKLERERP